MSADLLSYLRGAAGEFYDSGIKKYLRQHFGNSKNKIIKMGKSHRIIIS
jgi:hypothetical protein